MKIFVFLSIISDLYGFWILDFFKGIMDFDVKLKVDIAFWDEGMMLVLDMKPCEKERKDEEKKREDEED